MSGHYHFGNEVTQIGNDNIGIVNNQGPADPRAAFGMGDNVQRQPLRRVLGTIAGVAAMVGQAGVRVIEAVRKVMKAFGM